MAELAMAALVLQAGAQVSQGRQEKANADAEAKQMRQVADERRAVAQRRAIQARKQSELVKSRARAVAASSGAGATDPTVETIMEDLETQGTFNVMSELYSGEAQGQDLEYAARMRKIRGKQARKTGYMKAAGTLLGGGYTLYDRYGGGGNPSKAYDPSNPYV